MSQTLVRHTSAYVVARGLPALLNFAVLVYLTHALDAETYGHYAVLAATSLALVTLGYYGVIAGVRRFLPAHMADPTSFLRSVLGLTIGFVVSAGVVLAAVPLLVSSVTFAMVLAVWCLTVGQAWFELHQEFKAIALRPLAYGVLSTVRAGLTLALVWWTTRQGWGAYGVIAAFTLGYLVPTVPLFRARWQPVFVATGKSEHTRTLMTYGLPLAAMFGLQYVVSFSDRLLIASLAGAGAAGVYSAVYDLTQQTVVVVMMMVNIAAFPIAARALEERGVEAARTELRMNAEVLVALALPAAVGFALLAPNISHTLLGEEFREAGAQLGPVIALAILLFGVKAFYFDLAFQLGKATLKQLWITGVAAIVVTLLNLLWIPGHGAIGAAWATVCAFAVALALSIYWGRSSFALPVPTAAWGKSVAAVIVMTGVLWSFRHGRGPAVLAAQVGLGALSYLAVAYLLDVAGLRHRVRA